MAAAGDKVVVSLVWVLDCTASDRLRCSFSSHDAEDVNMPISARRATEFRGDEK